MNLGLGRLDQIGVNVADIEAAIGFYGETLGLRLMLRPHPTMAFFDLGGISLYLQQASDPADIAKASVLYLRCGDIVLATAELKAAGVSFVAEPHRVSEQPAYDLWMAFFTDPDGHTLALMQEAPKGYAPAE